MPEGSERMRLLVADDSQDDCHLVKRAFEAAGIRQPIEFVRDGAELLATLKRPGAPSPGLIMLDLNMPRLDGRESLALLRADAQLKAIPVIVLSTSNSPSDVLDSYRLGANAVVVKPFGYDEFVALATVIKNFWLEQAQLPAQFQRD